MIRFFALPIALQVAAAASPPVSAQAGTAPTTSPPSASEGRILRLDDAVQTALKHQPAVIQAWATSEAAVGRTQQARAGLLPQVTGTAIYQHGYGTSRTTAPGSATSTTVGTAGSAYDFFSFGANATQLLWDFGQTYERLRAADRSVDSLRQSERVTELAILLNVRHAFFQARAQRALIKVAEETVANEQKHMTQVQGFVTVGTRPEIDLAQEKTNLANDRVQLINAQNGYEIAKAQLNQTMGTVGTTDYDVADEELGAIDGEDQPNARLVEAALARRPELASLLKQEEAQDLTIRSIEGAYGPTLSAFGGGSEVGPSIDALQPAWNIGVNLTWPVFQGGLTRGQVYEAKSNLDATRAQLELERLQVRFDVEQAVLTVRGTKVAIVAAEEALTNAREQLRLAEGRYAAGVGSIIELGDAQVAATNAAAQLVQAQFNLSTARAQLLTAMGRR
jgi:outer membrane protein